MQGTMALDNGTIDFLELPDIVTEKILGFLSYEELANLRIVCRRFNQINQMLLNKGFRQVERYQAKCLREVKSQLPRRESERRNHPLFRHCDILTAIETRLSLLNMTFIKYVDSRMCCFIPGKVIDEIYRVLRFIQSNKTLPRAHEILTELRDISSMAMEHFEEKIIRSLKPPTLSSTPPRFSVTGSFTSHCSPAMTIASSPSSFSKSHSLSVASPEDVSHLAASNKYYKSYISVLKKEVFDLKAKVNEMRRKLSEQEKVALEQNRVISEQTVKLTGQEGKLAELGRKMIECEQRIGEVLGGSSRKREKQAGSCNNTSGSWGRDESASRQFYVTHGLPTSAVSPAVFVPPNIIQPNLVSLAAAPMSTAAYLPLPPLTGFSSGLALSGSAGQESSLVLSRAINPLSGFNSGQSIQGSFPSCSTPLQENMSQGDDDSAPGSVTSSEEQHSEKLHCKKHRKRKLVEEDGKNEARGKQVKV